MTKAERVRDIFAELSKAAQGDDGLDIEALSIRIFERNVHRDTLKHFLDSGLVEI